MAPAKARTLNLDPAPAPEDEVGPAINSGPARWVLLGMLGLFFAGVGSYYLLRTPPAPPPPEVMSDRQLLEGREVYLARCATCHGREGRGDGPIARDLLGPPVGNISDGKWKHGDRPQDVLSVISNGVQGTRMAGWGTVMENSQLRAVTAYVYYLARQPVPDQIRDEAVRGR
jgi:cytochrome c oxidase cbb3-type subunit 3